MSHAHVFDVESAFPQIATQFDANTGDAIPIANVLNILGSTVANATNTTPLHTTGAGNTITAEIQVGAAITGAPANANKAGLSSYDDTQFAVDVNGYVTLVGGAALPGIQTNTGDAGGAVGPDGSGDVDWNGVTVGNGDNTKPVFVQGTPGSNLVEIDVQVAKGRTGAPGNKNDSGLSSYDNTQFVVNTNGYVTLVGGVGLPGIQTLTSDEPTTVGPDVSGDIVISGGPGVTTTSGTNEIIVNSVLYSDETATTLTSDSGTWATAAGAYVLPALPLKGELIEIVCITTGIIVTANTGQEIQLAGDVTSTAGTATNSAKGDVLVLRYRPTDTAWYSISASGVWVLA